MEHKARQPQTDRTKHLARAQRQYFQWYWREGIPLSKVKKEFDKLSEELLQRGGDAYIESLSRWESRHRQWNKVWELKRKDRGLHTPMPENLLHLPLWRVEGKNVGDWSTAQHLGQNGFIDAPSEDGTFCNTGKDPRYTGMQPPINLSSSDSRNIRAFHPPLNVNDGPSDDVTPNDPFDDHHSRGLHSAAHSTVNSTAHDSLSTTGLHSDFFHHHDYRKSWPTYQAPQQSSTSASSVYGTYPVLPSSKAQDSEDTYTFSSTPLAAHIASQSQPPLNDPTYCFDWLQATGVEYEEDRFDGPTEDSHWFSM